MHMNHSVILFFSTIYRIEGYDRLVFKWWWAVLAIVALMSLLAFWRVLVLTLLWLRKPTENPRKLFKTLARIHGLSTKEQKLILGLVPKLPVGTPKAILFADPSTWAWKQVEDTNSIATLEKLYAKIFGFPRDRQGS